MSISIKVGSKAGVDVNVGSDAYFSGLTPMFDLKTMNFGYFYQSLTNAPYYGLAEIKEDKAYTGGAAMLAEGDISYSLSTHVVTGRLDAIAFGRELNGVTAGFGTTSTKMSLGSTDISFADLGLDADDGDPVNDILYGVMTGDGSDFLAYLASQAVHFTGGKGADSYQGGGKSDSLSGMAGADTLLGGKGKDTLDGGAGSDTLSGGSSGDQFVFAKASDSRAGSEDVVTDFSGKAGDRIDLTRIDADQTSAKNQAFDFIGKAQFSGEAGELRYETTSAGATVQADVDGDGEADFSLVLEDVSALSAKYFDL